MSKVVVCASGGLDSTVLLYKLVRDVKEVIAVGVNYAQRHLRELNALRNVCREIDVECKIADLSRLGPLLKGSSQTDASIPVPEGHYEDESMRTTVVPNRNMLLLSVAGSVAVAEGAELIAYAAHAGDHAVYPDCRDPFASAMAEAFLLCDYKPIGLLRPFVFMEKSAIVNLGHQLGVPFAETWSCYKGAKVHCGKCGTCVERREAFELSGVRDPTEYEV